MIDETMYCVSKSDRDVAHRAVAVLTRCIRDSLHQCVTQDEATEAAVAPVT
jgi:hypothetical protein